MSAASVEQVQSALDSVAAKAGFKCVPVSWEDAQRGTVDGALSCWGGNICDVRLWEKSGKLLYTLRSQNWNERLGYVSSKDLAVVVGNEQPGGAAATPVTLKSYLENIGRHAAYAKVGTPSLFAPGVDDIVSIRFQTVFLPIADRETVEFCTEKYNYNTPSDDDPRNLLLLCTPQGTSVQQDGARAQRIYYHAIDPSGRRTATGWRRNGRGSRWAARRSRRRRRRRTRRRAGRRRRSASARARWARASTCSSSSSCRCSRSRAPSCRDLLKAVAAGCRK